MKSLLFRAAASAALACPFWLANAFGQYGSPSLMPMPAVQTSYGAGASYYSSATNPDLGAPPAAYTGHDQSVLHSPTDTQAAPGSIVGDDGSVAGSCGAGGYGAWLGGGYGGCRWFGSVGGMIMGRDDENHHFFSYYDTNEAAQFLDSRDVQMDWSGGFEARFGRRLGCNSALEFVIWNLYPDQQTSSIYAVPGAALNGILNFDQLDITIGGVDVNVGTLVNNAEIHQLTRDFDISNLELNFWSYSFGCGGGCGSGCGSTCNTCNTCGPTGCGCGRGFGLQSLAFTAGVRYFRFKDNLGFAASTVADYFYGDPEEIMYQINTVNSLIGAQLGGRGEWNLCGNLSFIADAKVGVYGNHVKHHSCIGNSTDYAFVNNGPNDGYYFNINSTKNDVAFLGELDLSLRYRVGCKWSGSIGYRALGVTGVALPTNQIYPDLRGLQDVELVDTNGSLILHGAYARLEYCF